VQGRAAHGSPPAASQGQPADLQVYLLGFEPAALRGVDVDLSQRKATVRQRQRSDAGARVERRGQPLRDGASHQLRGEPRDQASTEQEHDQEDEQNDAGRRRRALEGETRPGSRDPVAPWVEAGSGRRGAVGGGDGGFDDGSPKTRRRMFAAPAGLEKVQEASLTGLLDHDRER